MKLAQATFDWPTDSHIIAQQFGGNANPLYAGQGLKGHPGTDIDAPWDAPIRSISRGQGYIYKKFNDGNPDLMKYRAICELVEFDDCVVEITYGHCHTLLANVGFPTKGQIIATVGNTGEVYAGDHEVTEAEKEAGSQAGRHLHLQFRKCQKVAQKDSKTQYLQDASGNLYMDSQGYSYAVPDYSNGFNGCFDGLPYLSTPKVEEIKLEEITAELSLIDVLKQYIQVLKGKLGL